MSLDSVKSSCHSGTMDFIGRQRELELLRRFYDGKEGAFVPVYGRRRVGKTTLLRRFCAGRPAIFFVGKEVPDALQRREFLTRAAQVLEEPLLAEIEPPDWRRLLALVRERWRGDRRLVVVLDEFQWTAAASPGLPSAIQELWDSAWQSDRGVMLVICGSYVGFMEREVPGRRSPLYGRRTAQVHLKPFSFREARQFHPAYSVVDAARTYFICGGVPAYLRAFRADRSVEQNIGDTLLDEFAPLHREADFLLREELREVQNYQAILGLLCAGSRPQREISAHTAVPASSVPYYLSQLEGLGYVARRYPLTQGKPVARHVRYELSDPLLRFWYRFVFPALSYLAAAGPGLTLRDCVLPGLPAYFGRCFEALCREALPLLYMEERVTAAFEVGQYWSPEVQIDVVGLRQDNMTDLGECKWGTPKPAALARELRAKAERYPNPRNATVVLRAFTREPVGRGERGIRWHSLGELYDEEKL